MSTASTYSRPIVLDSCRVASRACMLENFGERRQSHFHNGVVGIIEKLEHEDGSGMSFNVTVRRTDGVGGINVYVRFHVRCLNK